MSSAQQWAVVLVGRFGVIITHVPRRAAFTENGASRPCPDDA